MKATENNLLKFLQGMKQFIIPIYQRKYSWTLPQCKQLWSDVLQIAEDENSSGHFIGSIVYIEKGIYTISGVPQLLVIDGQQRLTTISLFLSALGKVMEEADITAGISRKKINNYYLLNNDEEDELRYKLQLSKDDNDTYIALLEGYEVPTEYSQRVMENYNFFLENLRKPSVDLLKIFEGIQKLIVVDIALDRDRDNPQLIFESLNSTGLDLSQADLIRNYILMGLENNEQKKVYNNYWHPMEKLFGQENYSNYFDRFMRDYLTIKTGKIPKIRDVYENFKTFAQKNTTISTQELVSDVYQYSKYYTMLAFGREENKEVNQAIKDISALKVDVAYPFLLKIYNDYHHERVSKEDFVSILRLVESYVFRRYICNIPTNSLNTTFATMIREIEEDNYLNSIYQAFVQKDSYRRFPGDEEFKREFVSKDMYNSRVRNYVLRKLENRDRKETVVVEDYTIEHILPQNKNLNSSWVEELGEGWKDVQNKYLHTIGNLTLTGYNSELSDRSFEEKRNMKGGFSDSPIRLNRSLSQLESWNEEQINKRGGELANEAISLWFRPEVTSEENHTPNLSKKVFRNQEELVAAQKIFNVGFKEVDLSDVENILSFTYKENEEMISVNLGQWKVLSFQQRSIGMAVDLDLLSDTSKENFTAIYPFGNQWTRGRNIQLAFFNWDFKESLPGDILHGFSSAVTLAYEVFGEFNSSSYMKYHRPELASLFVNEEESYEYKRHLKGEMLDIFNQLRQKIISLNTGVMEEYKKYYIAYKLDTNFVDIIPYSSALVLHLNMAFENLFDPNGVARNVKNIGHRGNGEVEYKLSSMDDIDYAMNLIEQSMDTQLEKIN